jgi:hypothetical protein
MSKNTQIKNRWSGYTLFEGDKDNTVLDTLEKAVAAKTNLHGANLHGAYLYEANLYCADLSCADLSSANLYGADLRGADLRGADLRGASLQGTDLCSADLCGATLYGANLYGANLYGANLYGANLSGAILRGANLSSTNLSSTNLSGTDLRDAELGCRKLIGKCPVLSIGPIGSRGDYIQAWITNAGVMIQAEDFFDTRDNFEGVLNTKHRDNDYIQEYRAALILIDKHTELWTPVIEDTLA